MNSCLEEVRYGVLQGELLSELHWFRFLYGTIEVKQNNNDFCSKEDCAVILGEVCTHAWACRNNFAGLVSTYPVSCPFDEKFRHILSNAKLEC